MLGKPLGWFKISEIRENSNSLKFLMQTEETTKDNLGRGWGNLRPANVTELWR